MSKTQTQQVSKITNRTILQGDALEQLKELQSNSIDLMCTDPPYGYSFMNKDWDKGIIDVDTWRECLRVLKPGAFAFIMSAPRQDVLSHMIVNLSDAGFVTNFTSIYWAYACLSADTEILTRHGWELLCNTKRYINEEILTFNVECNNFKWERPEKWNKYKVAEKLYRIKSRYTDQLVSKNHRVLTQRGFVCAESLHQQENIAYLSVLPKEFLDISISTTKKWWNVLLNKLQTKNQHSQVSTQEWQMRSSNVRRTETKTTREYDGFKELGMERWSHILQNTWKLCRNKICQMSTKISVNVKKKWLCNGTSFDSGTTSKESFIENRDSSSYRSQSKEQQIIQSNVIYQQQGSQIIRTRASYQTTLATVTKEYYDGLIFCPTVSTGCFVARRKGKIFLTGNSGFPKASNIGKMIDKRNGRDSQPYKDLGVYLKSSRLTLNIPQSEISKHFPSKTGGLTGCVSNWELGLNIPTKQQWIILKEKLQLNDLFDKLIEREEAQRKVIGKNKNERLNNHKFFNTNQKNEKFNDTIPSTDLAKKLNGSYAGFQPKPALEVILVCMKPLEEKNYTEQAMKNGKGITWLDDCRISFNKETDKQPKIRENKTISTTVKNEIFGEYGIRTDAKYFNSKGRFPANLLVSDDALNDGTVTKSIPHTHDHKRESTTEGYGQKLEANSVFSNYSDSGSFSRYFDLDAWEAQFIITPKASKSEKNKGLDNFTEKFQANAEFRPNHMKKAQEGSSGKPHGRYTKTKNTHPTVKPVSLFKYLITMGSRAGDVILDPFMGSGTTAIAAEQTAREWIGIEKNPEYLEICNARLDSYRKQNKLEAFIE